MKGILCLECADFRALHPTKGTTVTCNCGNVTGTWTNPERGWAKVKARNRETARAIGIHNGFLQLATRNPAFTDSQWKNMTQLLLDTSTGYLFHTTKRNCPFLIIKIGESNDIVWWEDHQGGVLE